MNLQPEQIHKVLRRRRSASSPDLSSSWSFYLNAPVFHLIAEELPPPQLLITVVIFLACVTNDWDYETDRRGSSNLWVNGIICQTGQTDMIQRLHKKLFSRLIGVGWGSKSFSCSFLSLTNLSFPLSFIAEYLLNIFITTGLQYLLPFLLLL